MTSHRAVFNDIEVMFSPAFPVNFDAETRRLAKVPGDAFLYVFCYNVKGILDMDGVHVRELRHRLGAC